MKGLPRPRRGIARGTAHQTSNTARRADIASRHAMWSRKIDRASRDCSTGPSDRAPSRTASGRVRSSASRIGIAARTADTAVTHHRLVATQTAKHQRAQQNHHDRCDQAAHRARCGGRTSVVVRDGRKDRLGEFTAPHRPNLAVEDQVHPQHRQQETAARQRQTVKDTHRASISPSGPARPRATQASR